MAFFFWGIIAVVFGVIWLGTLSLFIISRFYSLKIWRWIALLPFAGMTSCAIWIAYALYSVSTPVNVFKQSFGFAPTNDVREIKSQYWYFGDSGITYLKFKANPQTIKRIVALGLVKESVSPSENYAVGTDLPDWWKPDAKAMTRIYAKTNRIHDFASEEEMLCYDDHTQQAYYSFEGAD